MLLSNCHGGKTLEIQASSKSLALFSLPLFPLAARLFYRRFLRLLKSRKEERKCGIFTRCADIKRRHGLAPRKDAVARDRRCAPDLCSHDDLAGCGKPIAPLRNARSVHPVVRQG